MLLATDTPLSADQQHPLFLVLISPALMHMIDVITVFTCSEIMNNKRQSYTTFVREPSFLACRAMRHPPSRPHTARYHSCGHHPHVQHMLYRSVSLIRPRVRDPHHCAVSR
jgi:hypothetical protein